MKGLVELQGGRVEARSDGAGRGSEFIVTLPDLCVSAETAQPGRHAGEAGAIADAACRVLIADDNVDGAESLAMLVACSGHEVYVANTGPDALQMAAAHRPDVVVLDIGMPGMDGYQVAQRIRNEPWGADMLLIALTGWGQDDDKRRALRPDSTTT